MMNIQAMNTTALAYIGDAVFEVYVRKTVLGTGQSNTDKLHKMSVRYVKADGQAFALKAIMSNLTEQEQSLVKRARNRKITSKPQNADPVLYKLATAFEALVGYLYLSKEEERLEEVMQMAMRAIENTKNI